MESKQLSHKSIFKLKDHPQGRKKTGVCLGVVNFGKPLSFTGVYETYSFVFYKYISVNVVKFYINGHERCAFIFDPEDVSSKIIEFRYGKNLEIILEPINNEYACTLNAISRTKKSISETSSFILLNHLEYSLFKRGYHKYKEGVHNHK